MPQRRRKSGLSRRASEPASTAAQPLRRIVPGLANCQLPQANQYGLPEAILNCIDKLIQGIFEDAVLDFTVMDIAQRFRYRGSQDETLCWMRIADEYHTAGVHLRAGNMTKFNTVLKRVDGILQPLIRRRSPGEHRRLQSLSCPKALQYLQRAAEPVATDVQRMRYGSFFVTFWRICHSLVRQDLAWYVGWFPFLTDFLQKLAGLMQGRKADAAPHPRNLKPRKFDEQPHRLHSLIYLLCLVPPTEIRDVLRIGASRTIDLLAPGVKEAKRRTLLGIWTHCL